MATITWNNSSGGNWNTASDWTPNQVPGAGDDAEIVASGAYTVAITCNVAVNGLATVSSATVAINGGNSTLNNGTGTGAHSGIIPVGDAAHRGTA